jgi:hypothetical protein
LRPIRGKSLRANHKQRQTAAKLPTLMSGIRRLFKGYGILWQKLHACFSEHTFDRGNRVLVSRGATHLDIGAHLDIGDRVQTGRLSQVSNPPIQRSKLQPILCPSQRHDACAVVTRGKVTNIIGMGSKQWGVQ